jgi:hypothetical protein
MRDMLLLILSFISEFSGGAFCAVRESCMWYGKFGRVVGLLDSLAGRFKPVLPWLRVDRVA